MGTEFLGTICPWGPNFWGAFVHWDRIGWGPFVQRDKLIGDQLWGIKCPGTICVWDQMCHSPKMNEENTELVHLFGLQFKRLYLNNIFAMITAQLELRQD